MKGGRGYSRHIRRDEKRDSAKQHSSTLFFNIIVPIDDSSEFHDIGVPKCYKFFCGKEMKDAHSAEADTLATVEIFEGEIRRYSRMAKEELPGDVEKWPETLDEFHAFCNQRVVDSIDPEGRFKWKNGEAIVAFGKNAGTPLRRIAIENPDFLRWILRSDFSPEVREIASNALKGVFPEKKG